MDFQLFSNGKFSARAVADIYDQLQEAEETVDRQIIRTNPTQSGPGEKYGEEVIEDLHETFEPSSKLKSLIKQPETPPVFSYELWFDTETLTINWTLPDEYWSKKFRESITGEYPSIGLERTSNTVAPYNETDHVAGGTVSLRSNRYIPIKGLSGPGQFEAEKAPLRMLTSNLAADKTCSVFAQVLFKPAPTNWRSNPAGFRALKADQKARYLKEGRPVWSYTDPRIEDPTEKDLRQATAIDAHEDEAGFHVAIRYFVFGDDPDRVEKHVNQVGDAYRSTYNNREVSQGFDLEGFTGKTLASELTAAINREFTQRPFPATISEVAGLAHVPNGEVETPPINWTRQAVRSQVPANVPRKVKSIFPTGSEMIEDISSAQGTTVDAPEQLPPGEDETTVDSLLAELEVDAVTDLTNDHCDALSDLAPVELWRAYYPTAADDLSPMRLWDNADDWADHPEIPDDRQTEFKDLVKQIATDELDLADAITEYDPADEAQFREHVDQMFNHIRVRKDLESRIRAATLIDEYPSRLESLLEKVAALDQDPTASPGTTSEATHTDPTGSLPDVQPEVDGADVTPVDATYEWQEDPHTGDDRPYEIKIKDADGDVYLGRDPKAELFDIHDEHPDSPLWLGWTRDNRVGVREIGLEKEAWFRHMAVFGLTGTGKSTFNNNLMVQIAKKGFGFCYIDPKGDGVTDIITQLPDKRADDIVWIEPGSPDYDKVVGINFLEAAYDKDDPNYDREVAAMVDDLTSILKGGDYWGPKMEGITTNIARAMIRSEVEFNLMDMYYVLRSDESRQAFAENIRQEGEKLARNGNNDRFVDDMRNISTYTEQIAEMDAGEVDAVIRRIQAWVEDPIARGVVAHREGTINITEAVEDGKIILVNLDIDNEDIKEVVATAIMRRVWAAIKARREEEADRTPFFAFMDEFDDVVSPEMDIEKMLSKARSGKMGVNLTLQNPSQIADEPRQQMFSNARTVNSFGIGERSDADLISSRFPDDIGHNDIMEIPQFTVYTRVVMNTDRGRKLSPTLPVNSFADYPPVRSREEAAELIQQSLDRYGVEPLTETLQDTQMVLFNMGNNVDVHNAFLQAVWEVQIHREVEYASLSAVNKAFKDRTGKEFHEYPNGIQIDPEWCDIKKLPSTKHDPDELAEEVNEYAADADTDIDAIDPTHPDAPQFTEPETNAKGELTIEEPNGIARITDAGKDKILVSDHGYVPPSDEHNELLADGIFEWFTRVGFQVDIVTQENKKSLPDAEGALPVESETATLAEARKQMERLQEENELLAEISNGKEVAFEAEYSLTKHVSPLKNLARAANNNRRAIFMVPDGRNDDRLENTNITGNPLTYWADKLDRILNQPALVRDYNVETFDEEEDEEDSEPRTQVERTLYNTSNPLSLSNDPSERKYPVIQKDARPVWVEQDEAAIILRDGADGDASIRGTLGIEGLDDASANQFSAWCRYDKYEHEWVVYPEQASNRVYENKDEMLKDWQLVPRPFHPYTDIGPDYKELDPLITILRDEAHIDSPEAAVPLVYEREDPNETATLEPLLSDEELAGWDAAFLPRYDPIDTTPEALQTPLGNDERKDLETVLERYAAKPMNVTDLIPDTDAPYSLTYTPDVQFSGNKTPIERAYWESVFDVHTPHDKKITTVRLSIAEAKDGIKEGLAQLDNHTEAIKAGVKSGQLCVLNDGVILAKGWDRPKVILDEPRQYADRSFWVPMYTDTPVSDSEHDTVEKKLLASAAISKTTFANGERDYELPRARAAVQYAIDAGTLIPTENTDNPPLRLTEPDRPKKWKTVWDLLDKPFDAPAQRKEIKMVAASPSAVVDADSFEEAETHIEQAITNRQTLKETDEGLYITRPGEGGPQDANGSSSDDRPPGGDNGTTTETAATESNAPSNTEPDTATEANTQATTPQQTPGEDVGGASDDDVAAAVNEFDDRYQTASDGVPRDITAIAETTTNEETTDDQQPTDSSPTTAAAPADDRIALESPSDDAETNGQADDTADVETASDTAVDGGTDDTTSVETDTTSADETHASDADTDQTAGADTDTNAQTADAASQAPAASTTDAATTSSSPDANTEPATADNTTSDAEGEPSGAQSTTSDDDVSYGERMEAWLYAPTDKAPEGWIEAFDAAIDAFHDAAKEPIPANKQYNAIVTSLTERYLEADATCTNADPSANCPSHDHYVAGCPDCRVINSCTECGDDQQPIVRVEMASCGTDCTDIETTYERGPRLSSRLPSPPGTCDDCIERRYCAECAAADGLAPLDTGAHDDDRDGPAGSQPFTLHLELPCRGCREDGFKANADVEGERCYCETQTLTAPFKQLATTAEQYFTGPEWDSGSLAPEDFLNANHDPNALRHSDAHTDGRNWSTEAFEDNRLGWAPNTAPFEKSVVPRLLEEGHTPAQLYATGLFEPDWSSISESLTGNWRELDQDDIVPNYDLQAYLDDPDHELTAEDMVKQKWKGRFILPYFVPTDSLEELGDLFEIPIPEADLDTYTGDEAPDKVPVYACSRAQSTIEHPEDRQSNAKYAKTADYNYVHATEPIWGTETLRHQETVVVTEGIADAIVAADEGISVLSPVTVRFKSRHMELLTELCDLYDVSHVRLAQDNEPASISRLAPDDVDEDKLEDAQDVLEVYERALDSDTKDIQEEVMSNDEIRGPLSHFLETDGVSSGLAGAFSTEKRLLDEGYTPIHIDLPRLSTAKVDLDDYLSSGLADYIPLFPGLGVIDADYDEATEADVMELVEESGRVGRLYEAGYCHWRQETTAATIESDEPDTGVPAFDWRPVAPAPDEFTLDTTSPDATECLRRGLAIANDSELVVDRTNSPPVVRHRETAMTEGDGTPRKWREFDAPTLDRARVDDMDTEALIEAATKDAAGNFSLGTIAGRLGTAGSREDGLARPVAGVEAYVGESHYTIDEGDERQEITPLFDAPRVCDPREHPMWSAFKRSSSGRAAYGGGGGDGSTGSPKGASGRQSALYELSLAEVTGLSKGFRGKNPLGHTGDQENYWVFFKDGFAYDHKRDVGYNSLLYLAVEGNARTVTDPHGKFSDREILETWVHAKANGYIKEDDAVPLRGLRAVADQLGICSPEERLESKTIDGQEDIEVTDALPDAAYNETVARFESEYGVSPGRSVRFNTEHFLDDELTTENSTERFATQYLDTDVGEEDTIKPEYGYPRVPVEDVWAAYQAYCEINDVEPQTVYSGGKKQIAKAVGVERGKAYWVEGESESTACYKNVKLTAGGEWLRDRR